MTRERLPKHDENSVLISPDVEPGTYDAADDFARSLDEAYRAIRERVANGGAGWQPRFQDSQAAPSSRAREAPAA